MNFLMFCIYFHSQMDNAMIRDSRAARDPAKMQDNRQKEQMHHKQIFIFRCRDFLWKNMYCIRNRTAKADNGPIVME